MPRISVIIPNYNHGLYLKQRIDSVLSQTFQDFEVIILDDCSPDDSKEIIETYRGHPKVSYIVYNEKNSGSTFKQWDKAIALSKGEWIWIAESDDWCEPDFLASVLTNDEKVSISFAQTYICNQNTGNYYAGYSGFGLTDQMEGAYFVKNKMLPYNGIWNASQAIFRRSYFYQISPKYLEFRFCGDWIFWVELALLGDVKICGKFLCYFRKHDADVTSRVTKSGLRYLEEVQALEYFKTLPQLEVDEAMFRPHFYKVFQERNSIPEKDFQSLKKTYREQISSIFFIKLQGEEWLKRLL